MPEDLLIPHPSQRHRPAPREVALCVGCCSLDTIGALVGAYLGGGLRCPPDAPPFDPEHRIPPVRRFFVGLPNNQWYFWTGLAGVFLVAALVQPVVILHTTSGLRDWREAFVVRILWLVLTGPAYGLVAWLVASLWMSLLPAGAVTTTEWTNHSRALLWAFLGTLLGLIAVILLSRAGYELAQSSGGCERPPAVSQRTARSWGGSRDSMGSLGWVPQIVSPCTKTVRESPSGGPNTPRLESLTGTMNDA